MGEPARDWFPISFMSTFSDWADLIHGPDADWGQLSCGCHPNCGIGMAVMIDKETKEFRPVTAFLNAEQLAKDVASVNDAARGKFLSVIGVALALLRNYDPMEAPSTFKLTDLLQKFDKCFGATGRNYGKVTGDRTFDDIEKRRKDRWNFLFIAGMWFQDLFNYDFRRTEQCIIPYATQEGEISFCAYNTGVGWRNIIEKMHMTATLTKWYEEKGRHEIIAGGKNVNLPSKEHSLMLNVDAVNAGIQHDLDDQGIAKTAREEKLRKRNAEMAKKAAEDARMAKLYREVMLKEKPVEGGFRAARHAGRNQAGGEASRRRKNRKKSAASAINQFPSSTQESRRLTLAALLRFACRRQVHRSAVAACVAVPPRLTARTTTLRLFGREIVLRRGNSLERTSRSGSAGMRTLCHPCRQDLRRTVTSRIFPAATPRAYRFPLKFRSHFVLIGESAGLAPTTLSKLCT